VAHGELQKMQPAAPFSAPSPAHSRWKPKTARSKKLVGVTARRARLPSRATTPWGGGSQKLILAVGPGGGCRCFERWCTPSQLVRPAVQSATPHSDSLFQKACCKPMGPGESPSRTPRSHRPARRSASHDLGWESLEGSDRVPVHFTYTGQALRSQPHWRMAAGIVAGEARGGGLDAASPWLLPAQTKHSQSRHPSPAARYSTHWPWHIRSSVQQLRCRPLRCLA
jgi:hypothetical protein